MRPRTISRALAKLQRIDSRANKPPIKFVDGIPLSKPARPWMRYTTEFRRNFNLIIRGGAKPRGPVYGVLGKIRHSEFNGLIGVSCKAPDTTPTPRGKMWVRIVTAGAHHAKKVMIDSRHFYPRIHVAAITAQPPRGFSSRRSPIDCKRARARRRCSKIAVLVRGQ